jgi:hypothetical protein
VPQGNSLCKYLKQAKLSFFFLSLAKSKNRREEQILPGGIDTSRRGKDMGKGCKRVNMVQILCTHEWEWRKDTC